MPTSTRMGHDRFYDTLRQNDCAQTGGQSRPPLQGCGAISPMGCAILQLHPAGSMWSSTPTGSLRCRRTLCNFVIAPRPYGMTGGAAGRADVGIGPYKRIAWSPWVVRICFCILRADRVVRPYRVLYEAAIHSLASFPSLMRINSRNRKKDDKRRKK